MYGVILVRIFPRFSRIRTEHGEILRIRTLFMKCNLKSATLVVKSFSTNACQCQMFKNLEFPSVTVLINVKFLQ